MKLTKEQIIAISLTKGIGRSTLSTIIRYIESQDMSFKSDEDLYDFLLYCIENKIIRRIKNIDKANFQQSIARAKDLIDKSNKLDIKTTTYFDDDFPSKLKGLKNEKGKDVSPFILYYKGDICKLKNKKSIAIIGTREPSESGLKAGEHYGCFFASKNINIVSGLARGCDSAGHRGALQAKGGFTTAILAHGLDIIYPAENKNLAKEIIKKGGLLISEYPIGTPPMSGYFVERDRLQAGLSDLTLVIQTDIKGGTMHAVNATIQSGKPLFVVEYRPEEYKVNPKVKGNRYLLDNKKALGLRGNTDDVLSKLNSASISTKPGAVQLNIFEKSSIKAVIFDLDQTLVDSSIAENYRSQRRWKEVYSLIPKFKLYDGLEDVFKFIKDKNIRVSIVSNAPSKYIEEVTKYFKIPYNGIVAYHDVKKHKPDKEPMIKALELLNLSDKNVISFGDRAVDMISSNSANIASVACFWGTKESYDLAKSSFKHKVDRPLEIIDILNSYIKINE